MFHEFGYYTFLRVTVEPKEKDLLSEKIERFWDLDAVGIVEIESSVYENFLDDISIHDNRYKVCLPFKEDHPMIEDNHELCKKRLSQLKKQLDNKPELKKEYNNIIESQKILHIIKRVESSGEVGEVTYLPHHAVVKENLSTTKGRVDCDANAKNKGPSLNESLYKGPCLNPLLFDILLRFCVHNYGLIADIEKAYLQISVVPEHRTYLRFLWFDDVYNNNSKIVKYRFTCVVFGSSPSQFLLNELKRISKSMKKLIQSLFRKFYVIFMSTVLIAVWKVMSKVYSCTKK